MESILTTHHPPSPAGRPPQGHGMRTGLLMGLLTVGLLACTSVSPAAKEANKLVIDPAFQAFYQQLGGEEVLGPAISPKFPREGRFYQYTPAVLMVYDPRLPENQRFSLAPVGVHMGIKHPVSAPDSPGGHAVFSGFQDFYDQLGGAEVAGLPLTDVLYDVNHNSIKQYFENMGFYQLEEDAPDIVRLMAYGSWLCASSCTYIPPEEAKPKPETIAQGPFNEAISRLPPNLLGPPLTDAYLAPDGHQERIYTNAVVVGDPSRPGGIRLRPITAMLGFSAQLGMEYEVPDVLQNYILQSGGLEIIGEAVSAFEQQSDGSYLQCFENMCLNYDSTRPPELQVRPLALGELYKKEFYQKGGTKTAQNKLQTGGSITLNVSPGYGNVSPTDSQIFSVWVYQNDQPVNDVRPIIEVTSSNEQSSIYRLQPTREDGFTSIEIPPFDNAQMGTWVHYQVCASVSGELACVEGKYLIWPTR